MLGSNGRKLRTRAGYSPLLIEAGILEAKKLFLERKFSLDENEIENVSRIIGINAIKYSDLSCHLLSDYVFSYERMLRFEGNTAVFILYSYVRIVSIRRKIQLDPIKFKINSLELEHPIEIKLALIIVQFEDILLKMVENLMPHLLCDYLFNLASQFNLFFRDCRVDGHKLQNSRLLLCEATGEVLRKGMELLGLKVLEPVQNLFSSNAKNASTTICKLVLIFLSQFFHKRRHFSSQAKERSTTQRFGSTTNLCNSFRLTTSTFELMIPCTLDANFSPL